MSSTAGSNACIPSPASSHSAPSRNPTHRWWWRGRALDHHCVCRSCSTLYCSTSWPLMGGKTPNITTLVAITLQWPPSHHTLTQSYYTPHHTPTQPHYTHILHPHTTPPHNPLHPHTITPHTHTITPHTHTITSHSVDSSAERNIGRSEENVKLLQIPQQALRTSWREKLSLLMIQLMEKIRLLHFVTIKI